MTFLCKDKSQKPCHSVGFQWKQKDESWVDLKCRWRTSRAESQIQYVTVNRISFILWYYHSKVCATQSTMECVTSLQAAWCIQFVTSIFLLTGFWWTQWPVHCSLQRQVALNVFSTLSNVTLQPNTALCHLVHWVYHGPFSPYTYIMWQGCHTACVTTFLKAIWQTLTTVQNIHHSWSNYCIHVTLYSHS